MIKVGDIYDFLDEWAPFSTQMDFDNAGLLVGSRETPVCRVLVALDATEPVIREAGRRRCQLIVTHHPVLFHPVRALTPEDGTAVKLVALIKKDLAVISAHTNLDIAPGGVNDVLLERLGLSPAGILEPMGSLADGQAYGLGRVGLLPEEMAPAAFLKWVKSALSAKGGRAVKGRRPIRRVAVCGGSGGDLIGRAAALGCDALVTGDVKYDQFLEAAQLGVTLVDGGHFATENPVTEELARRLEARFGGEGLEVMISTAGREVYASL